MEKGRRLSRLRRSRTFVALAVAVLLSTALGIPVVADLNLILGASAQVAYTAGDGVNVRSAPGLWAGVITTLPESFEVTVLDGPVEAEDGTFWYLVSADGVEGWVIHNFLALPGGATDSSGSYDLASGISAYVSNTGGSGLRLRGSASYDAETLVVMPEGSAVDVIETGHFTGDGAEWWKIAYQEIVGFSAAAYLSQGASEAAPSEAPPTEEPAPAPAATEEAPVEVSAPASNGTLAPGSMAVVAGTNGQGVNLRYEWGYVAGVATVLSEGTVVYVVDGPIWDADSTAWYQVDASGTTGWIHGGYLAAADADTAVPDSEPEVSVAETPEAPAAVVASDPVGEAIVAEALRYVGLPYVWGGTTPAGFDCSGFTHYVLTQVFGYNFTRDMHQQVVSGSYVDPASLTPGDLVFFENTYTWGLSHVGIYIGGGQFVHAGSERTGVVISDLWDDYWGSRYYSARHIRS
jgi:cell wall-associated NlpC family hydrolase